MKPIPSARAASLRFFLSIAMFLEYVDVDDRSSDVVSDIMAMTASHRPMSDIDRGKCILYPSTIR
ncbi:MAG: hypothetical protein ACTSRS_20840 [Candidatus Helarchaeota archaeon]